MSPAPSDVTLDDVRAAAGRIAEQAVRTPVVTSTSLDRWAGRSLLLKCENLQRVGAFKFRGALNAVLSLDDDVAARGVAAHSSGNHAAALARAAAIRHIPAHVVMPAGAPAVKRAAVEAFGAIITECEPTLDAREAALRDVIRATGATEIHPYDDPRVIAGAGTAALELVNDHPGLDAVVAPVGGGGLLSGTSLAAQGTTTPVQVWGGEPTGADDAHRSLATGHLQPVGNPVTIADGLRTALSQRTFTIIRANVEGIVRVEEGEIVEAMRYTWERSKLVVEPSAAVAVAAARRLDPSLARVGVILSGGNVDLDHLPFGRSERA